jgi:hypothetical protein
LAAVDVSVGDGDSSLEQVANPTTVLARATARRNLSFAFTMVALQA